jgi:hypothetical protein
MRNNYSDDGHTIDDAGIGTLLSCFVQPVILIFFLVAYARPLSHHTPFVYDMLCERNAVAVLLSKG